MQRWSEVTLGEVFKALGRYRPFIVTIIAIVLIGVVLPGTRAGNESGGSAADLALETGQVVTPGEGATAGDGSATDETLAAGGDASTGGTTGGTTGGGTSAGTARSGSPVRVGAVTGGGKTNPLDNPDCDKATGRIRFPSNYAPPCVAVWPKGADNGGATHRGVTATEIVVVSRRNPNPDPTGQAILLAAGDDDTDEQRIATGQQQREIFEAHFTTYGRKVKVVRFDMSGEPEDDQAGRADAIKVATEIKAFAALGGSGAYKDELVARGVMCISCTTSEPIENYLKAAPYVWSTLLASSQAYILRAEYIGKKVAPFPAKHAGDPLYQTQKRKFGIVYYETAKNEYKAGVDFFVKELGKFNIVLGDRISYVLELEKAQEDARIIIARLKDKGITSVIFSGDPLMPIFLTKEATNQNYRPEWIITGSALTDTSFFARTYSTEQWSHAFGVSALAIGGPPQTNDAWRIHVWHHGHGPPADDEYGIMWATPFLLYTGIHMAGPNLTPKSYQQGMFAWPVSGRGGFTTIASSFGAAGKLWPWDDYLLYDDMAEIWWDATVQGKDETGADGVGLYQYVDGGKRYLPTEWPVGETKAFNPVGAKVRWDELPDGDKPPSYEHKHYH